MKVTVVSDLHLEFDPEFVLENPGSDTLILSGDILVVNYFKRSVDSPYHSVAINFARFIEDVCSKWKNVIYVVGNHEFYHGYIDVELDFLKNFFSHIPNLHILENGFVEIDDVLFVGSTLWFDGNKRNPTTLHMLNHMMNDFRIIQWQKQNYRKFRPEDAVSKHEDAVAFIKNAIEGYDGKIVVCTHHSPCHGSIAAKYKHEMHMNGGYHSDLSNLILDSGISLWTHGHTHDTFKYMLGDTQIVCNPKGYRNENPFFNPSLVIDV